MRTPVGSIDATMTFTPSADGMAGIAEGRSETVPVTDVRIEEGRVTWRQAITKPMRLTLDFEVEIRGDEMTGTSRAGRLPRSTVSGRRLPADDGEVA